MVLELGILSRRLAGAGRTWGREDIAAHSQDLQQALESLQGDHWRVSLAYSSHAITVASQPA